MRQPRDDGASRMWSSESDEGRIFVSTIETLKACARIYLAPESPQPIRSTRNNAFYHCLKLLPWDVGRSTTRLVFLPLCDRTLTLKAVLHTYWQDDYRLPEGTKRVGYDADTGRYTFRDYDGSYWEGAEGVRFGVMRPSE